MAGGEKGDGHILLSGGRLMAKRRGFSSAAWLIPVLFLVAAAPARAEAPDPAVAARWVGDFGLALYSQLQRASGNVCFCPLGVSTALALTAQGARGETAAQMLRVLKTPPHGEATFQSLLHRLRQETLDLDTGEGTRIASGLWLTQDRKPLPEFVRRAREGFNAAVETLDFSHGPAAPLRRINEWARRATNGMVPSLLPAGSLHLGTSLVVTSAVAFRGKWEMPFPRTATRSAAFHVTPRQAVNVPTMHRKGTWYAYHGEGVTLVLLPYTGETRSLLLVMSDHANGLQAVEHSLSMDGLERWRHQAQPLRFEVALPRFTVDSTLRLNADLQALGMRDAFDKIADFSGIDGRKDISIDIVLHHSYVAVDEAGTEAGAGTAVTLLRNLPPVGPDVHFDRPFLFFVRDDDTQCLLFMGRVTNPARDS